MRDELKRMAHVSDLMVSSHCLLRDRYKFRSTAMDIALVALSVVTVALSFASDSTIDRFNPTAIPSSLFVSISALLIFILSMAHLIVDWRGKSVSHADAARTWMNSKRIVSDAQAISSLADEEFETVKSTFRNAGDFAAPIPDKDFNLCKSHHLKKIALSKYLSDHPYASIWVARAKLWWSENIHS